MKNISHHFFNTDTLKNVNFNVKKGTVHALLGENGAGKSTLMKCLFGIHNIYKGEIYVDGTKVKINNPSKALRLGIIMVSQELESMDDRSIAENIFCNRYPKKKLGPLSIIDHEKMYSEADKYLQEIGLNISSKRKLEELSISQKQLVEIAKALSANAKLIILDEPSSSLTDSEVEVLFNIMNKLKKAGVSFIYISHKLNEILKISDEVSILRDGACIGTWDTCELDKNTMIKNMVGREIENRYPKHDTPKSNVILEVKDYSSVASGLSNISFTLHEGEILGIGGLVGARRTELIETIFGIRTKDTGTIYYKGKLLNIKKPKDAIKNGIALLTEDRHATGIFPSLSITDNIGIVAIDKYINKVLIVDKEKLKSEIDKSIEKLHIKLTSQDEPIEFLSGGNQQKALLARWLENTPDVLILDEPTRGIDIATKFEMYDIIADLTRHGKAIILISSEIQELMGLSDRIIVMSDGKIAGELDAKNTTQEEIMTLATKYLI